MSTSSDPTPQRDLRTLLEEEERRHGTPRQRQLRVLTILAPVALTIALLVLAGVFHGAASVLDLIVGAIAIFTVLGKFAILGSGLGSGYSHLEIAFVVIYMDVMIATVLVLNLPRLYRIPRVGPVLEDLAEHGHYMLETRPWLGRITYLGVVLFVMFPLTGTGAVGGSIFGRLLGLGARRTLGAIAVGSVAGSMAIALFGNAIESVLTPEFRDSLTFKLTGIAVLGGLIALVWWRGRRLTLALRARRQARIASDTNTDPAQP